MTETLNSSQKAKFSSVLIAALLEFISDISYVDDITYGVK